MQRNERDRRRKLTRVLSPQRERPGAAARANHSRVLDAFVRARRALAQKADRAA